MAFGHFCTIAEGLDVEMVGNLLLIPITLHHMGSPRLLDDCRRSTSFRSREEPRAQKRKCANRQVGIARINSGFNLGDETC